MECPICGSKTATILKTKKINSKKNTRREMLLKCDECGQVYNESIVEDKPQKYRLIISEHEDSYKTFVELININPRMMFDVFDENEIYIFIKNDLILKIKE